MNKKKSLIRDISLQREGGDSRGGCQRFYRDSIRVLVRNKIETGKIRSL